MLDLIKTGLTEIFCSIVNGNPLGTIRCPETAYDRFREREEDLSLRRKQSGSLHSVFFILYLYPEIQIDRVRIVNHIGTQTMAGDVLSALIQ